MGIVGKVARHDDEIAARYVCASCGASFVGSRQGGKNACPLCELKKAHEALIVQLKECEGQIRHMNRALSVAHAQLDVMTRIVSGAELCNELDLKFVTSLVEHHREGRIKMLTPIWDTGFGFASGLALMMRDAEVVERHVCSSIGGVAIAEAYREAVLVYGHDSAVRMLCHALVRAGRVSDDDG